MSDRNALIVAAYRAGETQQRIAAQFGLTQTAVSKVLRKSGIRPGRGNHQGLPADRALRLQYQKLRGILGVEVARREMGIEVRAL